MKKRHYTREQFDKIWLLGHAILDVFNSMLNVLPNGCIPDIERFVDEQWDANWHKYTNDYLKKCGNTSIEQTFFLGDENNEPIIDYDYPELVKKYIL